jgi:hypothetical protein
MRFTKNELIFLSAPETETMGNAAFGNVSLDLVDFISADQPVLCSVEILAQRVGSKCSGLK